MTTPSELHALIEGVRAEVDQAADTVFEVQAGAMRELALLRSGDASALERLESLLCDLLQACAFQDLVGQRLVKLDRLIDGEGEEDPLLAGPATPGQGLDQAAADALLNGQAAMG
jgi:hypothetical protein